MIEVFKIISEIYDRSTSDKLFTRQEKSIIRGNEKKIYKVRSKLNLQKYSFCSRVVNHWNSLPSAVVNAKTVTEFERKKLDRF